MKKYDVIVYIGRFQPIHNGHLETITKALALANKVIILVGSSTEYLTTRNPFSISDRLAMVNDAINDLGRVNPNIIVLPIRDYPNSNSKWSDQVRNIVNSNSPPNSTIGLIGYSKDESSWYLDVFPEYENVTMTGFIDTHSNMILNASDIRHSFFVDRVIRDKCLSPSTVRFLENYKKTLQYDSVHAEYLIKQSIQRTESSYPYPIITVCVDAVVETRDGYILLVRRGKYPGKSKYALPGGHLESNETVYAGAVRELMEETSISEKCDVVDLLLAHVATRVYDAPNRSDRSRVITHAHFFKLKIDHWPITGHDDAEDAMWVHKNDLPAPHLFFDDHFFIVEDYLNGFKE